MFDSQTYLHNAELEFRWLLNKLGHENVDLRAFQLTAMLATEVRRLRELARSEDATR